MHAKCVSKDVRLTRRRAARRGLYIGPGRGAGGGQKVFVATARLPRSDTPLEGQRALARVDYHCLTR